MRRKCNMDNKNSNLNNRNLLTSLFQTPEKAEYAYKDLLKRGYDKEDIDLMMSDKTHQKYFSDENFSENGPGNKALEGTAIGGSIGGTVGAIAAAIAAIGTTLVIPGLGFAVAGPLAASFAGAGAGATAGGLIGTLIGVGIPDEQAKEYEAGIKDGGVVISVNTKSTEDYKILENQWKLS